jgi:hypothetical protein
MEGEQSNLANNFPRLIDALRSEKLGRAAGGAACSADDESGCRIPDVHIGVVSSDLGAGPYSDIPHCAMGGRGAKLQLAEHAGEASCPRPHHPWISYDPLNDKSNVSPPGEDAIGAVSAAFGCMARLGAKGCGFEQQLEAARLALDPTANTNPGFVRPSALLAVVFITDEDDCSAADTRIYNRDDRSFAPSNFRCFEAGVTCDAIAGGPRAPGPRRNCRLRSEDPVLEPVTVAQAGGSGESYETFFKRLKVRGDGRPRPGQVIMAAIAGPTTPVAVRISATPHGVEPDLVPTCTSRVSDDDETAADPAFRIKALIDAFDETDGQVPGTFRSICPVNERDNNFGAALSEIGTRIRASLGRQCLTSAPLRMGGGLACAGGEVLGLGVRCARPGCLHEIDCRAEQVNDESVPEALPRCPPDLFADPSRDSCAGAPCPCWRVVARQACAPQTDGSPYAFEVVRPPGAEPPAGTFVDVVCRTSRHRWGSTELFEMLDEDADGDPERICM